MSEETKEGKKSEMSCNCGCIGCLGAVVVFVLICYICGCEWARSTCKRVVLDIHATTELFRGDSEHGGK